MSEEIDLRQQIAEAERARQLLKDPMIVAALDELRNTVYTNIRTSSFKQKEEREYLYLQLKAIDEFERKFKIRITNGKLAESRLAELKRKFKQVVNLR
jgi:predicted enzyme involved in methoxymalonyl-ACP biosynthesis